MKIKFVEHINTEQLKGKVAVITGASSGIGAATARLFAKAGAKVLAVSRSLDNLQKLADEINRDKNEVVAVAIAGDISQEDTFEKVFQLGLERFGLIDILVNAAGYIDISPLVETSLRTWEKTLQTNLRGSFLGCREMFRQATQHKHSGCVLNISSLGGIRGTEKFPGTSAYVVSKHGVVGLTEIAAVEGKPLGVRVNCIAPGAVDTEMLKKAAPFLKTQLKPEDLAKTILFLCDEAQSGKMSGSVIEIFSNE